VSWVSRIFRGSSGGLKISGAAEDAVYAESVRNAAFDASESDEAYRNRMAMFLEAVRDDGVERILAEKMLNPVRIPMRDAAGEFVYLTDDDGKFVLDECGKKQPMFFEQTKINNFYAAVYNYISKVNRLSHINAGEAKIVYWSLEDLLSDILMSSPRSMLNCGEIQLMTSYLNYFHILLMDAADGKKLRALLTVQVKKDTTVGVGPVEEKKKVL